MVIEILRPTGDGDDTELVRYPFSGNYYDKVNEETHDGDTTYLYTSSSTYKRCNFVLPGGTGEGRINGVAVKAYCRSSLPFPGYVRLSIETHSTVYESAAKSVGMTYTLLSESWATNPYTGSPWTWDEIDDLLAGISMSNDPNVGYYYSIVTQLWVEVDRASASGASISRGIFRGMFSKMR